MVLSVVPKQSSFSAAWHEESGSDLGTSLLRVVRHVQDNSSWRRSADDFHVRLYAGGSAASGLTHEQGHITDYRSASTPDNVCRMATDTLTAKIAKHRPLPVVLASRGNWAQQKRAKKMTQFIEGAFYALKVFEKHARGIVRDAGVFSRGLLKIVRRGKRPYAERTDPREVFVDEWDARYGDPRNLYQVRTFDAGVLCSMFPKHREAIRDAVGKLVDRSKDDLTFATTTVERVDVIEAWHLCDNEEAHEEKEDHACTGRHVIAVDGAVLVDEPWDLPYFPFAVLRYNDPISGWYGQGLVEQLEGYQAQLNIANNKLAEMYRMSGVGVWAPPGNFESEYRNGVGTLYRSPTEPRVVHLDLVNEHMRARPHELTSSALSATGLSQMSVMSQKPAGVQSGIALQTMDDVETERFIVFGRAYEAWCLDVARMLIDIAKSIAAEFGEYDVKVPMRGGILDLRWSDVEVDGYELTVFSTSILPQQPGARLEKLLQLFNTGVWGRDIFMREFESLDIQGEMDLQISDMLVIDEMLDSMLEAEPENDVQANETRPQGVYLMVEPFQNVDWAMRRAQMKYNDAKMKRAPEWNLQMLRDFVLDCQGVLASQAANASQTAPAPGAAPSAALAPNPPPDPMQVAA